MYIESGSTDLSHVQIEFRVNSRSTYAGLNIVLQKDANWLLTVNVSMSGNCLDSLNDTFPWKSKRQS